MCSLKNYDVEVVAYNPEWKGLFEKEAFLIQEALGPNCLTVHHIGSTSVPGLNAKPILDILPVVNDILEVDKANKAMEQLGYAVKGESGIAFRRFFYKGDPVRTHNVHVFEKGDPEIDRYLKFRDWLITHTEDRDSYANLKKDLALKFPRDILSYTMAKEAFVASIDAKDGFQGYRMVQALTDREWENVRALRKQYFLGGVDSFNLALKQPNHIHFIFYKNAEIIGYCHLELGPNHKAILKVFAMHNGYENTDWDSRFLEMCKRWLTHQGYRQLDIDFSKGSVSF